jgi:hypothetical protein
MRTFICALLCLSVLCSNVFSQSIAASHAINLSKYPAQKLYRFLFSPAAGMGAFLFYYPFHNYTPTFNFSVERIVHETASSDFGIGFGGGYRSMRIERKTADGIVKDAYRTTYASGIRGSIYPKQWGGSNYDVYLAGTAGFTYNQLEGNQALLKNSSFTSGTGFYGAAVVGAHYYFTKFLALFGEAGFDLDWVKAGLTFKI